MLNIRNVALFGATAVALGFGASMAYANGPLYSPYEILAPQPQQEACPVTRAVSRARLYASQARSPAQTSLPQERRDNSAAKVRVGSQVFPAQSCPWTPNCSDHV